jgi:transcriptional regulator with XRE-family HTH domain
MKTKMEAFEVLVPNLDGTEVEMKVPVKIPLTWDKEFGQWVLTPEAHEIIETTKARHMGLLLPEEFKTLRKKLGFTQKQMGELFQTGEKSWTRWESGKQRPSRSLSLLIRAVFDEELSVHYLLQHTSKSTPPPKGDPPTTAIWVGNNWAKAANSNELALAA